MGRNGGEGKMAGGLLQAGRPAVSPGRAAGEGITRGMAESERDYRVELEVFRGPLDLLLFLVKRQEVDIRDIPIAQVAEQFLGYLGVLEQIDVEWAGEFIVMAATLMEIKSKLLLPRSEEDQAEEDDPRLDLVKQ